MGFTEKSDFQEGSRKTNIEVGLPKKGSLYSLQIKGGGGGGGVDKKVAGCFWVGVETPCTLCMAIHHAESNNILLTRNIPFHSNLWQWDHPLMIPLHCLWAKSKNRTRGQFECDLTWFCFCIDFVHMHCVVVVI